MFLKKLIYNKKKFFLHLKEENETFTKKISIFEAEKKLNYTWLEWGYNKLFHNLSFSSSKLKNYFTSPLKILDEIEIKYMDKRCGWGMFAKNKIFSGDIIGVFTGKFCKYKTKKYDQLLLNSAFAYSETNDETIVIDGSSTGNITRFIQDLPTKEELKDYRFDDSIKISNIATENITAETFSYNNMQILYFFAARNINIGEIMGCYYGKQWWEQRSKEKRLFFFSDGTVIEPDLVSKNNINYVKK